MKRNGKKARKIRKLIIACVLSAVVLIVSTYTWFIGLQTVGVSPFEIEIATTEGLYLSMNGEDWTYDLDVTKYIDGADEYLFTGETNTWAEKGLIPVSTVGDLDAASSRMKLYEKASLTTSPGGYRLLASQVENGLDEEGNLMQGDGYIAFDLFIKNLSGEEYYAENNVLNEEAIYLNLSSSVEVKTNGTDEDPQLQTGIENSIRIGFAQIGRVEGTTESVDTITGITCSSEGDVTGICRSAQIWEPNETEHVQNAINWYNKSCISRKASGTSIVDPASYNLATETTDAVACTTVSGAVPTYAISREIEIDDNVDVYDGLKFNTYTANTTDYATYAAASDKSGYKLVEFPYFTDTMKNTTGTNRPTFMTLAPNSITKVRVYIWLEGQDIDNYDFAQLGKTVSIKFGFTKEKLFGTDIDYVGPEGVPTTPETVDVTE